MVFFYYLEVFCFFFFVNNGEIDKVGNVGLGEVIWVICNLGFEIFGREEYKCGLEDLLLCISKNFFGFS